MHGRGTAVLRRWEARLLVLLALTLLVIATVAYVDHRRKNEALFKQGGPGWACKNGRGRCDESAAVERRWNRRESAYKAAVVALGATTLLLAVPPLARRRSWR